MKSKRKVGKVRLSKETGKELLIYKEIFQDSSKLQEQSTVMINIL